MQYWLPVIDVGVRVGTSLQGDVSGMPVEIRVLLPESGCMWCRGILDAARIRAELLPSEERSRLIAEGYVAAIDEPVPSLIALNSLAASLAVVRLLQLWAVDDGQLGFIADPWEQYFQRLSSDRQSGCLCSEWRGRGDEVALPFPPGSLDSAPIEDQSKS